MSIDFVFDPVTQSFPPRTVTSANTCTSSAKPCGPTYPFTNPRAPKSSSSNGRTFAGNTIFPSLSVLTSRSPGTRTAVVVPATSNITHFSV